ncbi:MAG TPA: hypothetical protein PLJ26_06475 [Candidatus Omnitrophota bacterium]|nr:hypothetical protein [Candidatus Omnitrophota bacterium]
MPSRLLIGIDIGTASTMVVSAEKKLDLKVSVLTFPTPVKAAGAEAGPGFNAEAVAQRIREAFGPDALKRVSFFIRIPSSCVNALLVNLPVASRKDVNAPVSVARQNMIPASEPFHVFRSAYVSTGTVRDVAKVFFFVTRVDRHDVERLLDVIKPFKAAPRALVPADYSLPAFIGAEHWKKEEDIAFIDIGETAINIVIGQSGSVAFHRNIAFGLKDIFADLAQKLGVSAAAAQGFTMIEYGVPKVDFDVSNKVALSEEIMRQKYESGQTPGQVNMLELRMHWQAHLDRISQEIRRSLVYYKEQSGGRRVWRLYFSGYGAGIKNLISTLAAGVGGECRLLTIADCNRSLAGSVKFPVEGQFAACADLIGLMILRDKGGGKAAGRIDFIPPELHQRRISRILSLAGLSSLILACLIFGGLLLSTYLNNQNLQSSLQKLEADLAKNKQKQGGMGQLLEREAQIRQRQNLMESKTRDRNGFTDILVLVAGAVPADVVLNNTEFSGTTVRISGLIKKDYETASRLLVQFGEGLEALKVFRSVTVPVLALERIEYGQGGDLPPGQITREALREFMITAELIDPRAVQK